MPVLESGYSEYLNLTAQCYLGLGYSVIPVYGDLDSQRAKVCPIPWTYFQQRRASVTDLRNWFIKLGYGGLGIVTGRISGLVVLDFDDPALAQDFASRYPDLTETWTIESGGRKLPHYYYRLPLNHNIPSQKRDGVDLQSGGRYVVAPPTTTMAMEWRVQRGGQPKMLTERDLKRISNYIGTGALPEVTTDPSVFAFLRPSNDVVQPSAQMSSSNNRHLASTSESLNKANITSRGNASKLISQYNRLAHAGRNEALFQTAIWARDHGWQEEEVKRCLVELYVRSLPAREHRPESPERRRREAICTIASAYSRPPRAVMPKKAGTDEPEYSPQAAQQGRSAGIVTNAIREAMLKRKETAALRVLEALALAGLQPGQMFTEREAREIARRYAVGEWSVRKALRQGELFKTPEAFSAKMVNTAKDTENTEYKKCFFVIQTKPTKNKPRGRPTCYYVMPDQEMLCAKLGVQIAPGSRISPEDLRSCRIYRQSLLRELVKRRPGHYSRDWLAGVLGVSVNTTRRYTRDLACVVTPTYYDSPLLWHNLDSLIPPDIQDARPGSFLEDGNGKKYPPIRPVAQRLLQKSRIVFFKWRGVNHYGYTNPEPQPTSQPETGISTPIANPAPSITMGSAIPIPRPMTGAQPVAPAAPKYTQPLADIRLEAAARHAYERMLQPDSKHSLSLANARALVVEYGELAVGNMVNIVLQRRGVRNPAGYLKRLLRQNYGFMAEESLTIAEVYAAERAFIVTKEINPRRALSWPNACKLAREHGQVAIERAIMLMRERQVKNPAGFLIKLLRSEPSLGVVHAGPRDEQFVEYVYSTLRQINPQRALSRKIVKRLVAARGRQAVADALHLMKQRGNIQNPAGFLVTLLRAQNLVRKHHKKDRYIENGADEETIEDAPNGGLS